MSSFEPSRLRRLFALCFEDACSVILSMLSSTFGVGVGVGVSFQGWKKGARSEFMANYACFAIGFSHELLSCLLLAFTVYCSFVIQLFV